MMRIVQSSIDLNNNRDEGETGLFEKKTRESFALKEAPLHLSHPPLRQSGPEASQVHFQAEYPALLPDSSNTP